MEDSVIFNSPFLLLCLGIALFLSVFDLKKRSSGFVLPLLSILLALGTVSYALLLGATFYEAATVLILFGAVNLLSFSRKGDGK